MDVMLLGAILEMDVMLLGSTEEECRLIETVKRIPYDSALEPIRFRPGRGEPVANNSASGGTYLICTVAAERGREGCCGGL